MNLSPEQRDEYGYETDLPPRGIILSAWACGAAVGLLLWGLAWAIAEVTYPWVAG